MTHLNTWAWTAYSKPSAEGQEMQSEQYIRIGEGWKTSIRQERTCQSPHGSECQSMRQSKLRCGWPSVLGIGIRGGVSSRVYR